MASPATIPVVEIPYGPDLGKRKRDVSEELRGLDITETRDAKRTKLEPGNDLSRVEAKVEAGVEEKKQTVVDSSQISEIIASQFSLDILLKHNELRLIRQELGKCQAALEQLRRCHLIPFPASLGNPESMLNVCAGTGPAVGQQEKMPQWAAPYGVTDGPYTRHYAKWLIPDPRFDGMQVEWQQGYSGTRSGKTIPEGRSTRHSFAEGMSAASKSRSQRGAVSQKLQALPSGYPPVKDKVGPCRAKRSDGQEVKLVCLDCKRENFSSTQGFINHCRIAHRREFKSHEEAAMQSGQPIEVDEAGDIIGEEKPTPTVPNGLVHPLVRSAPVDKEAYRALLARIQASKELYKQGRLPGVTSIPTSAVSKPAKTFVPSSATPHLSDLLRSRGFGGNLDDIVLEAKKKVNLDELSDDESDEEEDISPFTSMPLTGGLDGAVSPPPMRVPAGTGASTSVFARPGSSKGPDRLARQPVLSVISPRPPYATPINTAAAANHHKPMARFVSESQSDESSNFGIDVEMLEGPSLLDLSPNTIVSNNAPSLVSDDGEYDEGDDAESVSSDEEAESSDVAEIDIADEVPVLRKRSGSGSESMRIRKEKKADKHVTFVSPIKGERNNRSRRN